MAIDFLREISNKKSLKFQIILRIEALLLAI